MPLPLPLLGSEIFEIHFESLLSRDEARSARCTHFKLIMRLTRGFRDLACLHLLAKLGFVHVDEAIFQLLSSLTQSAGSLRTSARRRYAVRCHCVGHGVVPLIAGYSLELNLFEDHPSDSARATSLPALLQARAFSILSGVRSLKLTMFVPFPSLFQQHRHRLLIIDCAPILIRDFPGFGSCRSFLNAHRHLRNSKSILRCLMNFVEVFSASSNRSVSMMESNCISAIFAASSADSRHSSGTSSNLGRQRPILIGLCSRSSLGI